MESILNYTPHVVNITWTDLETGIEGSLSIQPQPEPIRLFEHDEQKSFVRGIPCVVRYYQSGNLPEYDKDKILIVSQMVAAAFPERRDLFHPAADIRNDKGQIIGTSKLCQVPLP